MNHPSPRFWKAVGPHAGALRRMREYRTTTYRRGSARRSLQLAKVLFGFHLVVAPLLLAGVYPWGMLAIACNALLCLVASAYARGNLSAAPPAVVWVALLLLLWTALQATPLPCGLVGVLSPGATAAVDATRAALGDPGAGWCSLSYDPGATQQEVVKGVGLVSTLIAAWILTAGSARRDVFWIVAGSALVMSCVALGHALLGLKEVFGVYQPVDARSGLLLAPILNANVLGAFAGLGAPLWLGLTHRHTHAEVRWFGRIATLVVTVTAVLTLSRGAIAQVLGTLLFLAGYMRFHARHARGTHSPRVDVPFAVLGVVACGLASVAYIAGGRIIEEFARGDLSKLSLLGRAFAFALEHPWFGVGRGAFSSAFLTAAGRQVRFGHAENFVAQWASEWGLPITLLWLVVVAVALVRRVNAAKSLATIAAATALLGLCAQNLVDLGFELVGVATVAIALLGAVLSPSDVRSSDAAKRPTREVKPSSGLRACVAIALVAGVVSVGALGPRLNEGFVPSLEKRLQASLAEGRPFEFAETLRRAVALHPAEPVFAILAATEGIRHSDPRTVRWLNRAMQLAPHWAAPHILAYQYLLGRGYIEQAVLELRLAAERDASPGALRAHLCTLARIDPSLVLGALPVGQTRLPVLEMASNCVSPDSPASEELDRALLEADPTNPSAMERAALRHSRNGDLERALAMFARLIQLHPDRHPARVTRARVLRAAGRYEELVAQLDQDLGQTDLNHRPKLLSLQADAYARLKDEAGMRRALDEHRRLVGTSVTGLAENHALEGSLHMRLENFGAALTAFHAAYRINGDTRYLSAVAQVARRLGNRSQELWAHMQLCQLDPRTRHCEERDRLLAASPR